MCSYTFGVDAASVLQYAAAVYFFGIFHKYCPILPQNSPIIIPIHLRQFLIKKKCAAFLGSMQQLCSHMLQQWFLWVYWIIISLFYHKISLITIFSPFELIIHEKSNMLHFWPICCMYAAVCSSVFFWGIWIIVALPSYKMFQIIIFSPFDATFNEKPNMQHFWPVCSKNAAICCSCGFFGYYG